MANYCATTRSNYFRVKDEAAFLAWCKDRHLEHWTQQLDDGLYYAISADTGDCCGWPTTDFNCEHDDEIDIGHELADHLDQRDIAIILEVGSEKLRYLTGFANAIHPDGRMVTLTLADIYAKAAEAFGPGVTITEAMY